jgi:hypothetical protein
MKPIDKRVQKGKILKKSKRIIQKINYFQFVLDITVKPRFSRHGANEWEAISHLVHLDFTTNLLTPSVPWCTLISVLG